MNSRSFQNLLLVEVKGERLVMPLTSIVRLEEFERSRIEMSSNEMVIQYRGGIMPLVNIGMHSAASEDAQKIHVVVVPRNDSKMGLIVDRIVDIVQSELIEADGTVIIEGRVTRFLNVDSLLVGL